MRASGIGEQQSPPKKDKHAKYEDRAFWCARIASFSSSTESASPMEANMQERYFEYTKKPWYEDSHGDPSSSSSENSSLHSLQYLSSVRRACVLMRISSMAGGTQAYNILLFPLC